MNDAASRGMAGSWSQQPQMGMGGGGGIGKMGGGGGMNGGFSGYGMSPWGGSPFGGGYGAAPWSPYNGGKMGGGSPMGMDGAQGGLLGALRAAMNAGGAPGPGGVGQPIAGGSGPDSAPTPALPGAPMAGSPPPAMAQTPAGPPSIVQQYQDFQRMNATDPARAAALQGMMGNDQGAGWRKQMNSAGYYAGGRDQNGLYNYAQMPANQQNFGQNRTMI